MTGIFDEDTQNGVGSISDLSAIAESIDPDIEPESFDPQTEADLDFMQDMLDLTFLNQGHKFASLERAHAGGRAFVLSHIEGGRRGEILPFPCRK